MGLIMDKDGYPAWCEVTCRNGEKFSGWVNTPTSSWVGHEDYFSVFALCRYNPESRSDTLDSCRFLVSDMRATKIYHPSSIRIHQRPIPIPEDWKVFKPKTTEWKT